MIRRDEYLEKLKKSMWDNNVKVITGIRRCGKSTLLFDLFGNYLTNSLKVDENHLIKIKFDTDEFFNLRNPILLSKYLKKVISNDNENIMFLLTKFNCQNQKRIEIVGRRYLYLMF